MGPVFELEARLVHGLGASVELTESPVVHVALWQERGRAQRWVSIEIREGELSGKALFVPVEALQGEGRRVQLEQVAARADVLFK